MKKKKTTEQRLKDLEDFHYRVQLGSKWLLCAIYALGGIIAFISYLLSSLNSWNLLHGK